MDYKDGLGAVRGGLQFASRLVMMGVPGPGGGWAAVVAEQATLRDLVPALPPPADGSFTALPVLAVRAARRAIAANPDHPDGYYALARALSDPNLPHSEAERALGLIAAYRQCLDRFPPPAEFGRLWDTHRRNVYAASPTGVALELAALYAGLLPNGQFRGIVIDLPVIGGLAGDTVVQGGRRGRIPFLRALDLSRQAVLLAADYAAIELRRESEEVRKRELDRIKAFQKQLDDVLRAPNERYTQFARQATNAGQRYQMAREAHLVGEAIRILLESDIEKEFDKGAPQARLELVALLLCVGRVADAARELEALRAYEDLVRKMTGDQEELAQFRVLVRYLDYHKLVLEGNYAAAGAELEALDGRVVGQNPLAGVPKELTPAPYLALGMAWPVLPMLGAESPLGVVARYGAGYAQQQRFLGTQNVIGRRLQAEATFFFRRGFLSLLEGDVVSARERFKQSVRQPPPDWGLPSIGHDDAAEYLRLIEAAERRAP
jgi:hypothetical protein